MHKSIILYVHTRYSISPLLKKGLYSLIPRPFKQESSRPMFNSCVPTCDFGYIWIKNVNFSFSFYKIVIKLSSWHSFEIQMGWYRWKGLAQCLVRSRYLALQMSFPISSFHSEVSSNPKTAWVSQRVTERNLNLWQNSSPDIQNKFAYMRHFFCFIKTLERSGSSVMTIELYKVQMPEPKS